jgi:hypothetical protein
MKLRRVKRYRGTKATFGWTALGVIAGGGVVWLIYKAFFETPASIPAGSIVTSSGQVLTPAQQAQILTPVSLVG